MSDLTPDDRELLDRARQEHEPTAADQARVRASLFASVGVGLGVATARSALAATTLAKAFAAVAVAGALAGGGFVAYRAARGRPPAIATNATASPAGERAKGAESRGRSIAAPPALPALEDASRAAAAATPEKPDRALAPSKARAESAPIAVPERSAPVALGASSSINATAPALETNAGETPIAPSAANALQSASAANAPPSAAPTADAPHAPSTIEAELELVRGAVAALHGGDGPRALALLDEHARRYPDGILAEERDAERVVALCDLDRTSAARDAAAAFLRLRPHSALAAKVRASCAGTPNP